MAYRGDRFRHSLALDLPEDLPAGRYSLLVGDGASVDAARLALEPVEPVTFAQALELLRSFHSRRDLMVLGVYGGPGLSVAGEVMPRLPGSVRSLWSAAASGSATPLRSTVAQEQREAWTCRSRAWCGSTSRCAAASRCRGRGRSGERPKTASRRGGEGRRRLEPGRKGVHEIEVGPGDLAPADSAAAPSLATQVKIFQTQSQAAFLAGTLEGVSVDSLGRMRAGPPGRARDLALRAVPALRRRPSGRLGGRHRQRRPGAEDRPQGRGHRAVRRPRARGLRRLGRPGRHRLRRHLAARQGLPHPRGKARGQAEVFFDPGETYIWTLARAADGALLVATGTQGKLFKVDARGKGEVLYDSDDTHVRASLLPLPGGDVLLGTAGEGLILRSARTARRARSTTRRSPRWWRSPRRRTAPATPR